MQTSQDRWPVRVSPQGHIIPGIRVESKPGPIPNTYVLFAGGAIVISTALYTNIALRVPEPFRLQRITAVSFFGGVPALIAIFSGAKLSELFGMKVLMACSGILIAVPTVLVIIFLEEIGQWFYKEVTNISQHFDF